MQKIYEHCVKNLFSAIRIRENIYSVHTIDAEWMPAKIYFHLKLLLKYTVIFKSVNLYVEKSIFLSPSVAGK